jgi:hypothetical protein
LAWISSKGVKTSAWEVFRHSRTLEVVWELSKPFSAAVVVSKPFSSAAVQLKMRGDIPLMLSAKVETRSGSREMDEHPNSQADEQY